MIRKKVHFPILFLMLVLGFGSCKKEDSLPTPEYYLMMDKGNKAQYKNIQLDSAYFYYNQAKEFCPNKAGEEYNYAMLQMATIQQYAGDYYGAEETITEGLANYKGEIYKPYFYQLLAVTYDKQKKYEDALPYYEKAYATFKDDTAKAITKNNIGLNYLERNQYLKAILILKPQLKSPFLQNKDGELARVLDNIGYSQFKLNSKEANSNLFKAFQLRDSLQDYNGLIASNLHLSEYYSNDAAQSKKYAVNALIAAKKVNSPDDILNALRWLIRNSDPVTAKQYTDQFLKLNDSLSIARISAKNQFAKIKYDSATTLKNLEIQKGQKQLYFILFLSAVLLSILLYFLIRSKNRNKLKSISYLTETRISKKLHDELANDVYNAMTFAETQNLQLPDKREMLLDNLDKIYSRTRNISKENSSIQTDDKFVDDLKEMLSSYSNDKVNIITKNINSVLWSNTTVEKKIAIYRVLQELMVNMKKHSEASLVIISFEYTQKFLKIQYTDNGKGVNQTQISKKGLQNAENRINAVKGTFTFDPETTTGFRVIIHIPK